jgi:hypothetical protein
MNTINIQIKEYLSFQKINKKKYLFNNLLQTTYFNQRKDKEK